MAKHFVSAAVRFKTASRRPLFGRHYRGAPITAIRRCGLHVRKVPNILSLVDPGRLNGNANELKQ